MSLFIGRLARDARTSDLEEIFSPYGKLVRCEVKSGSNYCYGFVEFENRDAAEEAYKKENDRSVLGVKIAVEWAKSSNRSANSDDCFNCSKPGHYARDCPEAGRRGNGGRGGGRDRFRGGFDRDRRRDRSRSPDRRRDRSRSPDRRRFRSPDRRRDRSPDRRRFDRSPDRRRDRSPDHRSPPPPRRDRSRSPPRRERSRSPDARVRDKSPDFRRDRSPLPNRSPSPRRN